jgi:Protein of unknown function (DUF2459)
MRFSHVFRGCVLAIVLTIGGCASVQSPVIDAPSESLRSIYVIRRGWHTGIALPARDWPNRDWNVLADFPETHYLEFGWGDARFYQSEPSNLWLGSRAALWPTSSAIHVIGLREPIRDSAHARDLVEVRVPIERMHALATAIEREFAAAQPAPTGATLRIDPKPNGFYAGKRRFYFPRMCNWWTASRLREAGCLNTPATVLFASRIMEEARECAAAVTPP